MAKRVKVELGKVGKTFAYYRQNINEALAKKQDYIVSGIYIAKGQLGGKTPKTLTITIE